MIDVTLQNFETELIAGSMARPVLLDIWAPWCGPCRTLGPMLEKLETEYAGRFLLAKVNADEQPEISGQLSQMFGVRSIPFCVMFVEGQPVDGFVGALPESQIREFLDKHVPAAAELEAEAEAEEAEALAEGGHPDEALAKLRHALETDPANDTARGDLIRLLLAQGDVAGARAAWQPWAPQAIVNQRVVAFGTLIEAHEQAGRDGDLAALDARIATNRRDFDARFARAQALMAAGAFTEAMDELLEILMRDKAWADGRARVAYVAILELMTKPAPKPAPGEPKGTLELTGKSAIPAGDPVVDQYRRKLSMALF